MPSKRIRKIGNSWAAEIKIHKRFRGVGAKGLAFKYIDAVCAMEAKLQIDPATAKSCCTIRDKLHEFLRDCLEGNDRNPCNERTANLHLRRLKAFDRAFHSKPLDCITRREVEQWRERRRKEENGRGGRVRRDTVNADIGSLKAFARWAQSNGWAPAGLPLETVKRLREPGKLPGKNQKPPEILPLDEVASTIKAIGEVRPDVELVLRGMFLYCLRPVVVTGLRRRDVVLPKRGNSGRLFAKGVKGGHDRTLELLPDSMGERWVWDCLRMWSEHGGRPQPDDPLLLCISGRSKKNPGGWTVSTLDQAVHRICRTLDLDFRFYPYLIRHSTISFIQDHPEMAIGNVQVAAGHLRATTQEAYSHRKASQAAPAFGLLDGFLRDFGQLPGDNGG